MIRRFLASAAARFAGMRARCRNAAILCAVLLAASSAAAEKRTDQLMWMCEGRSKAQYADKAYCIGYLGGMNDMNTLASKLTNGQSRIFCTPKTGVSGDQLRMVFIDWAKRNPGELHKGARVSALLALAEAFPCAPPP